MAHGTVFENNIFFFFSFVCVCVRCFMYMCIYDVWIGSHIHMSTLARGGLKTGSAVVPQKLSSCLLRQGLS